MCSIIKQSDMRGYFVSIIFEVDEFAIMSARMLYVSCEDGYNWVSTYFIESLRIQCNDTLQCMFLQYLSLDSSIHLCFTHHC